MLYNVCISTMFGSGAAELGRRSHHMRGMFGHPKEPMLAQQLRKPCDAPHAMRPQGSGRGAAHDNPAYAESPAYAREVAELFATSRRSIDPARMAGAAAAAAAAAAAGALAAQGPFGCAHARGPSP